MILYSCKAGPVIRDVRQVSARLFLLVNVSLFFFSVLCRIHLKMRSFRPVYILLGKRSSLVGPGGVRNKHMSESRVPEIVIFITSA
ncbi:hypothetical protein HOY80DRAFT_37456 [Tuber brumale]|nr:hypothetical protein HOY80DRAFT_37456 [Tuber brumale]